MGQVAGFRPGTPEEVKNRILFSRDARYQELAQIANPLISGAGWEGISGKNYIGPRNIKHGILTSRYLRNPARL
jgi:hypothetical protein